ncbi:MAG: zinc metalloprotease HtpX [Candidatus Woesearchaeota archaeon]|nr:MAG: zinc metalloprotease HtpX [Candidatus Woesearchaeota archaeon]
MLNQIKTAVLLAGLTGILLIIGFFFGGELGLIIAFAIAMLLNFVSYWYSDKIVLRIYRAKELPESKYPKIHKYIKEVSKNMKIPKPRVYLIPTDNPNAFATGRNPKHSAIALTDGIMHLLTEKELKGVIAHELAHIKNRDTLISTVVATIAGAISFIAIMARFAAIFGGGRDRGRGLELIIIGLLAPFIALIIRLAISRSREYLADETGAKLSKNPEGLASALKKISEASKRHPLRFGSQGTSHLFIVNPFSKSALVNLFSTHPSTQKRVEKLRSLEV